MFQPLKIMETNFEQSRVILSFLTYNWETLIQIPSVHAHKITFSLPNHCETEGSCWCDGGIRSDGYAGLIVTEISCYCH